jgi:hypothetical protein
MNAEFESSPSPESKVSDISLAKREIIENAGNRNPEQINQMISQVESILDTERQQGEGKLADTIDQTLASEAGDKYFVDRDIVWLPPEGRAIFIGDLHGDANTIPSILEQTKFLENMEAGSMDVKLVFLGDYADRGKKDIQTLEQVLALKLRYPNEVILLRGNHEDIRMGDKYGLLDSLWDQFEESGKRLFDHYNQLFEKLPGICLVGNGVIAVHGGIPGREIGSLKELQNKKDLFQIRWADPSIEVSNFGVSRRGGITQTFGHQAYQRFMENIGATLMIRGHEAQPKGVKHLFSESGRELISLFSTGVKSRSTGYNNVQEAKFMKLDLTLPLKKAKMKIVEVEYP